MALVVHKYGGTSMGSVERIQNVAKRVAKWVKAGHQVVVVPSAMSGETNRLLGLAKDINPDAADMSPRELEENSPMPTIVLSHNPKGRELLGNYRWDLMLSGHTHGGQIKLPFFSTPLLASEGETMHSGFHPYEDKQVFVTRGIGYIGPGRFNCPPEINLITIP